jgi:Ca-activated chloride channel family protein
LPENSLRALTLLALLPGAVWGQVPRYSARAELVVLSATAVDGKGRPVTDLRAEELRVFEEGRLQRIAHFSEGKTLPARVLLLVDASGSMNTELKITSSRMAAYQILGSLGPEDETALAGFDHEYWGLVPFTRDRERIKQAFSELVPFGSTALHDALDKAARDLASHGEGRRAVVVITDGMDTSSTRTPDEVIARSRALDVPIYAVSVISPLDDPSSPLYVGRQRPGPAAVGGAGLAHYAALDRKSGV